MADVAGRRSPLRGIALPEGLRELPFLVQLDLRLDPADRAARAAVETVIGALPAEPDTVHGDAGGAVLWLGPDEWLVVRPPDAAQAIESHLRAALAAVPDAGPVAIIDVSANRTTLELSGADARAILAGGCSIDLDPNAFGPGRCAQTLVSRAGVILWQTAADPAPTYRLLVRSSFAAYLAAWLTDAMGQ